MGQYALIPMGFRPIPWDTDRLGHSRLALSAIDACPTGTHPQGKPRETT